MPPADQDARDEAKQKELLYQAATEAVAAKFQGTNLHPTLEEIDAIADMAFKAKAEAITLKYTDEPGADFTYVRDETGETVTIKGGIVQKNDAHESNVQQTEAQHTDVQQTDIPMIDDQTDVLMIEDHATGQIDQDQTDIQQTEAQQTDVQQSDDVQMIDDLANVRIDDNLSNFQQFDAQQTDVEMTDYQTNDTRRSQGNVNEAEVNQVQNDELMMIDPPQPDTRPVHFLGLTPLDHTTTRGYTSVYLCFPFNGDKKTGYKAYHHLGEAFRFALSPWPFLAGRIINGDHKDRGTLRVKYRSPVNRSDAKWCQGYFNIGKRKEWTYKDLTKCGAPLQWFNMPVAKLRLADDDEAVCPATLMQVSFVDGGDKKHRGGLIVGLFFHRAVLDGPSIQQFLHAFAAGTLKGPKRWKLDLTNRIQDRYQQLDFLMPRHLYSEADFLGGREPSRARNERCDEYDPTAPLEDKTWACRTCIFEIKKSTVTTLKAQVRLFLQRKGVRKEVWEQINHEDCLSGLFWVGIMRARAVTQRLPADTPVKFTTEVDARGYLSRPTAEEGVPLEYMGNLTVSVVARTTLAELVGREEYRALTYKKGDPTPKWKPKNTHEVVGIRCDISMEAIANAALLIRRTISRVDDNYVKTRMALSVGDSTRFRAEEAADRAADTGLSGVDFSSRRDWTWGRLPDGSQLVDLADPWTLNGSMYFEIPGVASSYPDFVRCCEPEKLGQVVVLPRWDPRGDVSPYEVAVCLEKEEMGLLRGLTEMACWVHRAYETDEQSVIDCNRREREAVKAWDAGRDLDIARYVAEKKNEAWLFELEKRLSARLAAANQEQQAADDNGGEGSSRDGEVAAAAPAAAAETAGAAPAGRARARRAAAPSRPVGGFQSGATSTGTRSGTRASKKRLEVVEEAEEGDEMDLD